MKISVCICTYNGEEYIEEQVKSIINQTVCVDEIVLSDDNSTDNTIKKAETILKQSNINNVILKNEQNLGVTKNFEKACLAATGDIIFFSDQDDIWLQNKVERVIREFENNNQAQLVFSDAVLFDENGDLSESCWERFNFDSRDKVFNKNQMDCILKRWFVTGATMAVRRDLLEKCLPFKGQLLHDQILSFVACSSNSCCAINDKLIKYRQHSNQVVGAKKISLNDKIKLKVDNSAEINQLQALKQYIEDSSVKAKIDDKCDFLQTRSDYKKANKIARIFKYINLFPQYKKYKITPFKSYLKDVLT